MAHVFLVEPYFSGSHRAWAEGFADESTHDVHLLTLAGRFWKWRMFGGSLTLGRQASVLAGQVRPDVLLVSDMVDLPSLIGHGGPDLAGAKTILYMHENQLTYPLSPTARDDLAYAYMNWSSMVRADEVWFNSRFHFDSVFDALDGFLRHFPDNRHNNLIGGVAEKSQVMPVGVDLGWAESVGADEPPLIIWNQRWEYDKDPVRLFEALYRLADTGLEFRLALCGENFRNVPSEFETARRRLADHIVQYGHAEVDSYRDLLNQSAIVLSTAKHEFFGIGAVEAMSTGAIPVFPNDLSYPELVPAEFHTETLYDDDDGLDLLLQTALSDPERRVRIGQAISASMARFSWGSIGPAYDRRIHGLTSSG